MYTHTHILYRLRSNDGKVVTYFTNTFPLDVLISRLLERVLIVQASKLIPQKLLMWH